MRKSLSPGRYGRKVDPIDAKQHSKLVNGGGTMATSKHHAATKGAKEHV